MDEMRWLNPAVTPEGRVFLIPRHAMEQIERKPHSNNVVECSLSEVEQRIDNPFQPFPCTFALEPFLSRIFSQPALHTLNTGSLAANFNSASGYANCTYYILTYILPLPSTDECPKHGQANRTLLFARPPKCDCHHDHGTVLNIPA
jgi:hypothetical protein